MRSSGVRSAGLLGVAGGPLSPPPTASGEADCLGNVLAARRGDVDLDEHWAVVAAPEQLTSGGTQSHVLKAAVTRGDREVALRHEPVSTGEGEMPGAAGIAAEAAEHDADASASGYESHPAEHREP